MKSKIIIPGGSGFIGKYIARFFNQKNYEIIILTRGQSRKTEGITYLNWDGKTLGDWTKAFEGATLVLNLSGRTVDCRYTEKNKKEIIDSRVESTKIVGEAIQNCTTPPEIWVNMSTATIYQYTIEGKANDEVNGIIGNDFSMNVAKAWEKQFNEIDTPDTRKIVIRTSIVLGKGGGAFVPFTQLARFGLGGKNGSGKQFVSWIHLHDMARIMDWFIENKSAQGIYNCASPTPVPNHFFMKKIREACGVSFGLPATAWMIEMGCFFMQTESELVLKSRKVVPKRLLDEGFVFEFEELGEALGNDFGRDARGGFVDAKGENGGV